MIENLLPRGSRLRAAAFAVVSIVVTLIFTQVVMNAAAEGGTPSAILFRGFVFGLLNALIAAGLILIYRTTRIINFAQAALGSAGGVFTFNLGVLLNWPFFLAFVAGVLVSALLGLVVELGFIRRFFDAPRLVLTVLTIALIGFLSFASAQVQALPIFGDVQDRDLTEIASATIPLPFSGFKFTLGDLPIPFGFGHIFAIVISFIALGGLAYFFKYTKAGVAIRASSENSDRALLLGINVKGLSTMVWVIAATLSGVGIIASQAATGQFTGAGGSASFSLMLTALAACVIARMKSLPVAVLTAVLLTVIRESVRYSFPNDAGLVDVGVWLIVLIALLFQREARQRSEATETSSWKATEEQRPIPKELLEVAGVRIWRRVLIGVGLIIVLLFPWVVPTGQANIGGFVAISAIVVLSLVVLTGWAGQVSLGQFAFVAVGAIVGGSLTSKLGWSFWLALPIGAALTSAFAMLVGLPALRIKGLFLGITTFAFAFAVQAALFNERYFGWALPDKVDRPTLFLLDFEDERSMYYLCVLALVLAIVVVTALRRSRPGRVLIALRDNEANVQSFAINAVRTRLAAFALSGFLCGFAGVIFAHHQRAVTAQSFRVEDSINVFLFGVVGGIGSVAGALLGTVYFALQNLLQGNQIAQFFVGQVGILVVLYVAPGGLASVAFGLRDSVLRIVAQRRQMVVPALFADIDPEAAELQLAPLAEPQNNAGLAALPFHRRYKLGSYLHGVRKSLPKRKEPVRAARTIGAAAENLEARAEAAGFPVEGAPS